MKTTKRFVEKAKLIHYNKYNYSLVNYCGAKSKVYIICPEHGQFHQTPSNHLSGFGCFECGSIKSSISKNKTARDNFIINAINIHADWHGNPKIYNQEDINVSNKRKFGELYSATIIRENILKEAGYNIISIWEADWKQLLLGHS